MELCLALPVLLIVILGGIEAGMLTVTKFNQDQATVVVAQFAAQRPGEDYHAVANRVGLGSCEVSVDTDGKPGIVSVTSTCSYQPIATRGLGIFDGIPVSSSESAVVSGPAPSPTPAPSPSESVTP